MTEVPSSIQTLGELFHWRCRQRSQDLAYALVRDTLEVSQQLSYAELERLVASCAQTLTTHANPGDRVLLLCTPGLEVVVALWSCFCAGLIPVPAPPPDPLRLKNSLPQLKAILHDAEAAIVVTSGLAAPMCDELRASIHEADMQWIRFEELMGDAKGNGLTAETRPVVVQADKPAYLQYTSGSTAAPRGVMISHRNTLAQCRGLQERAGVTDGSRSLCWLPYFHDYGLVHGILGPFYAGIPAFLMSPLTFLRRPLRWLEAIERFQITHSGAPNFAYEFCTKAYERQREWSGALHRWENASCGAEPIHPQTLDRFSAAFSPHGFKRKTFMPAYGLAESTLVVSSLSPGQEPLVLSVSGGALESHQVEIVSESVLDARSLIGCGSPLSNTQVAIVNPETCKRCESDGVGEIWVAGPSVAQGYWNKPDLTAELFDRSIAGQEEGRYLRTGDLGFMKDGQLFITGRLKDLIILNGRNLYPNDIEAAIQGCHPSMRAGGSAAFSVEGPEGERLAIVQEIEKIQQTADDEIANAIRLVLAECMEVPVWSVVLVRTGGIPRTSSGKVQRQACRKAYLSGQLPVVATSLAGSGTAESEVSTVDRASAQIGDREAKDVKRRLLQILSEQTGIPANQLNLTAPIVTLGLDSLGMGALKHRVHDELGVELTFVQLFGPTTITDLLAYVEGTATGPGSGAQTGSAVQPDAASFLSPSQARLWFLEQVQPGSALNHISLALHLHGVLKREALEVAFNQVVERYAMLRTGFTSVEGTPRQTVYADVRLSVRHCSLRELPPDVMEEEARRWIREEALVPFDLARPPLMRVLLLEQSDMDSICVLTVHRLVADGWSLRLLCRDVAKLYNEEGGLSPHAEVCRYADYVAEQTGLIGSVLYQDQLTYWGRQLKDLPAPIDLPTDRPRPHVAQHQGGARTRWLDEGLSRSLDKFCRSYGATKFMVLYAAFTAWLHRCARTDDVVVGSVVANRRSNWNELFGYAVNSVVLRIDMASVATGEELLTRARQVVASAYDHQDVPFEQVAASLGSRPNSSTGRLFNVMLVWEDDPLTALTLRGVTARRLPIEDVAAEFDLTLLVVNGARGLELTMLYDRALFDAPTVDRMLAQIEILLSGLVADPGAKPSDLPLLGDAERTHLLATCRNSEMEISLSGSIAQAIESRLLGRLDRVAVQFGETQITYGDLMADAERLARRICERTQGHPARVGLCVERSAQSLVGIMGILKSGCAYVPLDPDAPDHRQRFIVEDADLTLLVTQRHLRSQLPATRCEVFELESLQDSLAKDSGAPELPAIDCDRAAYVIYTSGSTGYPKGVEVTHRSLLYSLGARLAYYKDPVERCLLTFPFAFDGSITGIFWTLLHAGTLIIPTEDQARDPRQLAALIARHQISHIVLVPSLYDAILNDVPPSWLESLRVVVAAGESLPLGVVQRHHERVEQAVLFNEYGPTEATVWSSVYRTTGTEQGIRVPIGRPIAGSALYVVDAQLRPVPVGVIGEIVIVGAGVANGYLNRPDETAARFLPDPFGSTARLYRTGDLGLLRQDGNLEFIGRADNQVKLRGYRIELDEIEASLGELPSVRDKAVVIQDGGAMGPLLVAFVTSADVPPSVSPHLLELLKRRIPSYMAPAAIVILESMPLLSSGKIDRQALRSRAWAAGEETAPLRPRDSIEHSVMEIWSRVLGQSAVDVNQNFFALGGHSLLATQVVSRIREMFRVELPLRALFETPTIAGVAAAIREEQRRTQAHKPLPPIVPVPRTETLPLSYSQQRMWFVQQLAPDATAYNLLFVSRQKGVLNVPVLRRVLELLSRRHEAFRTTFVMTGNGLVQRVAPWRSPHLVEIDLRTLPKEERETAARRLAEEEGKRPFDLERGALARIALVKLDQDDHLIVLNLHHIVGDQWSFGILGRDFSAYYNALCQNVPPPDIPLPIQYADYAVWQRRCLTEDKLGDQESHWTKTLENLTPLYLPTDYPRPSAQTFRGSYCSIEFPDALLERLKEYSAQHHVTTFMTMLACFQILLSRYSGQSDIAVGSPIANRTQMAVEHLVGTFVNTLVFRTNLEGDPTFDDVVGRVKEAALGAFANQDYPFDRLVDHLQVDRDPSMGPLVQVLFNMVNAPIGDIQLWGLKWEPFEVDPGTAQFDLSLTVEMEFSKKAYLTYNTDLFKPETAQRILNHFVTLLRNVLSNPTARLSDVAMLSRAERFRMLEEWNRTSAEYPKTQCLPELIAGQVATSPNAVALSMDGRTLTYGAMNARANQLARLLQGHGVKPGIVVGVCLERSIDMVVALLAVMKAGGAYLPLDPDFPRDRVRFMVEDSETPLLITTSAVAERFSGQACDVLCLDRIEADLMKAARHDLPPTAAPQELAYILYTSGSTGQPKGVEISHRSLVNFLWSMKREPGCSSKDVLLAVTTLSFDIAGLELYLLLLVGGRVEIVSRATSTDGRKLSELLSAVRPTIMQATPATWRLLLESGWSGDSELTVLCGGEALSTDLAERLIERTKALWNMYGPTETTIWSTVERIELGAQPITIGRPIANTEVYILDRHRQPVPIGVSGEIYIGGDGLARGYHRRSDLTSDRFVKHPFSADPDARLYRTGDVARYREDGKILHLGRIDHQVKIRGFRIELGEIETVLGRHPKLKQAVVTAQDDQFGLKQLAAYLIPSDGEKPEAEELRSYLRAILPDYMVPAFFVFLDRFPLTANKKVDVRALPAPDVSAHAHATKRVGPNSAIEVQLTALWQQVLGVQDIGIHDNFFDLGGHSLKAAQLFFQLELVFGRQLPLATLFQAPTIAELAAVLTQANWTPPWQSLVAIQPAGSAPPLFMVPGVGGNVLVFARLAKLLGIDQPIYGLQARGLDGNEAPFTSVSEMAAHYVQQLRRVVPHGPYRIAGVCTGGLIAYEMAQQLAASGKQSQLFMMDTWHPDSYTRYRYRVFGRVFMAAIVAAKVWLDVGSILHSPLREWWPTLKRKGQVLASLMAQSVFGHIQDQDFQIQRLTQATLLAVARYRVKRFGGQLVNVIASSRNVDEQTQDTRHRWEQLAGPGSCTLHVPAEDSGRLFVSPHVEEVARHMQRFLETDRATGSASRPSGIGTA